MHERYETSYELLRGSTRSRRKSDRAHASKSPATSYGYPMTMIFYVYAFYALSDSELQCNVHHRIRGNRFFIKKWMVLEKSYFRQISTTEQERGRFIDRHSRTLIFAIYACDSISCAV